MKRVIICIVLIIATVSCGREEVIPRIQNERDAGDSVSVVAFSSQIKAMGVSTRSAYISPSFDDFWYHPVAFKPTNGVSFKNFKS